MASNLNRCLHSHIPCRIHGSYCICAIIHTRKDHNVAFHQNMFVCIFQGLFNAYLISGFKLICIRFFFFCVHYASAFQEVFL